jgi:hypothetical protein
VIVGVNADLRSCGNVNGRCASDFVDACGEAVNGRCAPDFVSALAALVGEGLRRGRH